MRPSFLSTLTYFFPPAPLVFLMLDEATCTPAQKNMLLSVCKALHREIHQAFLNSLFK